MTRFAKSSWLCVFCTVTAIVSPAQTFQTIASFDSANGANPQFMSLVQGTDGNFYGTTPYGGAGLGAAFGVSAGGGITPFCFFGQGQCYGGNNPYAGLIQASDGNFYGTTWQGGTNNTGTVFEVTTGGMLTVLHNFCSLTNCADGDDPYAPLLEAANKNFYGTTLNGGTKGYGTVFEITSAGALTTLHSFRYTDGASPTAGLIQARNGNFYGTTLYEITAAGKVKTLHSFGSAGDGAHPYLGLVQATNGKFYGTTHDGGAHGGGTVFQITAAGTLTTLHSFCFLKNCADGANPYASVIQAANGNFYGTTSQGGTNQQGTIFEITAAGKLTTLHSFCAKTNCTDGANPWGGLIQATSGIFYGTTSEGGYYGDGTIFSLKLAHPFQWRP
jgi:uncharacterized repeat protein (TIGR03803 family)